MNGSVLSSTGRWRATGARHCRSDQWRDKARLWLDATYIKARRSGRIVSVAAIVAVAVNLDGRREVLGIAVQPSEAEVFRDEFLRSLADRGLRGTRLIIADDHKGLKAAAAKVLGATVQRCRVHFMRNALACVGKKDRPIVTAALRTAFDQDTLKASKEHWAKLIEAFEPRHHKLAELMRRAEDDVLAYKSFPRDHRAKIHSTNPLERLNKEIKRRTNVVGIFPNEAAVTRLVGALMLEQNDEWAITRRHMTLETVTAICDTIPMDPAMIAALQPRPGQGRRTKLHHPQGHNQKLQPRSAGNVFRAGRDGVAAGPRRPDPRHRADGTGPVAA